jgi:hypothetical protein
MFSRQWSSTSHGRRSRHRQRAHRRHQRDRPDIINVTSSVNVRNVRMLAVNRRLGYREIRRRSLVQANVSDLGRQLSP